MAVAARSAPTGRAFRALLKTIGTAHRVVYQASGGRIAGKAVGLPILLLTTTGRKTGKARTTPLCFLRDGDAFVVVASNGGRDWFPAWWLNLVKEPRASIQVGRTRINVTAREASLDERQRLWAELTKIAPVYLRYRQRARRKIPLGILSPSDTKD